MARPQRFCIFCGESGLTYEHVWADWLKSYIPKDMPEHDSLAVTVHPTHSDFRRNLIAWPPKRMMNDQDADQIAAAFQRQSDEVGRKMTERSWQKSESNPDG